MKNLNDFHLHIGESSWDSECLKIFNISAEKTFLHNDYFKHKTLNKFRVFKSIKIFMLVFFALLKNKKIIFTSINSDAMLVQAFFIFYKKCYFFIPNVCGYKEESHIGAKIYRFLIKSYAERVIVSDEVTQFCLRDHSPSSLENLFRLSKLDDLPKKSQANFIVVLPAPETHKDSNKIANHLYDFHLNIFNYFYLENINVFLLIHPRDRGHTIEKLKENNVPLNLIIDSSKITTLENVVYVSGFSSLCLNKRYNGDHGIWISMDGRDILKDEFTDCKKFLINIEDIL